MYVAKVKFPSAGSWSYEVYDGFTQYGGAQTHTFGAISVGAASGGLGLRLSGCCRSPAAILLASRSGSRSSSAMRRMRPRPAPQV